MSSDTSRDPSDSHAETVEAFKSPEVWPVLVEHLVNGPDYIVLLSRSWDIVEANNSYRNVIESGVEDEDRSFLETLTDTSRDQIETCLERGRLDGTTLELLHALRGGSQAVTYHFAARGDFWVLIGHDQSANLEVAHQMAALGEEIEREIFEGRTAEGSAEASSQEDLEEHDRLTGLATRRQFERMLEIQQARYRSDGTAFSLISVDIDHFKQVNEVYGHPVGDLVLQRIGHILQVNVREDDFVARIGGQEFTVIVPGLGLSAALQVAERLRLGVEKAKMPERVWRVTISLGVSSTKPSRRDSARVERDLRKLAASALQFAKKSGRNCVRSTE